MIPNNTWSSYNVPEPFATFSAKLPPELPRIAAVSIGPLVLSASNGNIAQRFWMVSQQVNKDVVIFKASDDGSAWIDPVVIFTDSLPIVKIALTFDQLGRPIVFYQTTGNELKLYWFNPVTGQNVIQSFGTGDTPVAGFDYVDTPDYPESDAWLFYVKGNSVYSRLQRERWDIERLVRTYPTKPRVVAAGLTQNRRFQVIVDFEGFCPVGLINESFMDTLSIAVSFKNPSLILAYVNPPSGGGGTPPVVEDPDPPIIVDPPVVEPPSGQQGYWLNPWRTNAWLMNTGLLTVNSGFKTSIKVKRRVNTVYDPSYLIVQGAYVIKSPTNQYYNATLFFYMFEGKFHVTFAGNQSKTPVLWTSAECPLCKVELEITKDGRGSLRYWEELEDGSGYKAPIEYVFPMDFKPKAGAETDPYEKFCLGGVPQSFGKATNVCDTILRDFVFETESISGQWSNRIQTSLGVWGAKDQGDFSNYSYKDDLWYPVTNA